MNNTAIIVLGMHRSGTSALTGMLSLAGAYPGTNLMPAVENINPKGFWEHTAIVMLHEQLLAELGSAWYDTGSLPSNWLQLPKTLEIKEKLKQIIVQDFSKSPLWILKDPRLCRLLPLWQELLQELQVTPKYIFSLRSPQAVAASLYKRDNLAKEHGNLLWLIHFLESISILDAPFLAKTSYTDMLKNPLDTVQLLNQRLSLGFTLNSEQQANILFFLDKQLNHYTATERLEEEKCGLAANLAHQCYQLAERLPLSEWNATFQSYKLEAKKLMVLTESFSKTIVLERNQHMQAVADFTNQYALQSNQLNEVLNSRSWKITQPLRKIKLWGARLFPIS